MGRSKFWIVLAVLLLAPGFARAGMVLDSNTERALEGDWASDCDLTVVVDLEAGYSAFSIDFVNSGGSVFYGDGVDFSARGWITDAVRRGREVRLSIDFFGQTWPLRLTMLSTGRLQVEESEHFASHVMRRCAWPDRRPVAGISRAAVRRFSKGVFSLLGPESKMDICAQLVNGSLSVDLAGPNTYVVQRFESPLGEPAVDEYWTIRRARPFGNGLRLRLHEMKTAVHQAANPRRQQLTLTWLDDRHLRAVEWKRTYLFCAQ